MYVFSSCQFFLTIRTVSLLQRMLTVVIHQGQFLFNSLVSKTQNIVLLVSILSLVLFLVSFSLLGELVFWMPSLGSTRTLVRLKRV